MRRASVQAIAQPPSLETARALAPCATPRTVWLSRPVAVTRSTVASSERTLSTITASSLDGIGAIYVGALPASMVCTSNDAALMYATRPLVGFATQMKWPVATGTSYELSSSVSGGSVPPVPAGPASKPLLPAAPGPKPVPAPPEMLPLPEGDAPPKSPLLPAHADSAASSAQVATGKRRFTPGRSSNRRATRLRTYAARDLCGLAVRDRCHAPRGARHSCRGKRLSGRSLRRDQNHRSARGARDETSRAFGQRRDGAREPPALVVRDLVERHRFTDDRLVPDRAPVVRQPQHALHERPARGGDVAQPIDRRVRQRLRSLLDEDVARRARVAAYGQTRLGRAPQLVVFLAGLHGQRRVHQALAVVAGCAHRFRYGHCALFDRPRGDRVGHL